MSNKFGLIHFLLSPETSEISKWPVLSASSYIMKTKDEAYNYFVEYMLINENELKRKSKIVRFHTGREFINREFEELFRLKGITHQRTVPYNPQSNEVTNRSILNRTRTMVIDAQLPERFWGETAVMAAYVKNRMTTKADTTRIPLEEWEEHKPI